MINWKKFRQDPHGIGNIASFSVGSLSLNKLRNFYRENPEILSEIYTMERMGVRRVRNAARKALKRMNNEILQKDNIKI